MATLIDALYVEIGLDPSKFVKGQKQATESFGKTKEAAVAAGKDIEKASNKAADGIEKIARQALTLFAILTGASGLKSFLEDLAKTDAALGRFAANLGQSPQAIAGFGMAVERLGGNAGTAQQTLERLGKTLNDYIFNGKSLPDAFFQLESLTKTRIDTNGGTLKYVHDLSTSLQQLYRVNPSRAHFIAEDLGLDDGTFNLMVKFGPAIDNVVKSVGKLAPTDAQIKASQDMLTIWVTFQQTAASLGQTVLPALDRVMQSLADAFGKVHWNEISGGMDDINESASTVASSFDRIAAAINVLIDLNEKSRDWPIVKAFNAIAAPTPSYKGEGVDADGVRNVPDHIGPGPLDGARASGGPVSGLKRYLVGEKGPEILNMGSEGGSITPNNALGGGDISVEGRPVGRGNPLPISIVNILDAAKDLLFGGDAGLSYLPGGGMGSGGGGLPRHPGSGRGGDAGAAARATAPLSAAALKGSSAELVAYIRQSAIAHGIDPEVALRVARSEGGLSNPYRHGEGKAPSSQLRSLGSKENSYGPFQLYISGTGAGLGDRALKAGVDPRTNWKAGIDFALDEVRRVGWDQWYGAQHQGIRGKRGVGALPSKHALGPQSSLAGFSGAHLAALRYGGGSTTTSHTTNHQHIGNITVVTQATDAKGIAASLRTALANTGFAGTANGGPS